MTRAGCRNAMRPCKISGSTDEHDAGECGARPGMTRKQRRLTIIGGFLAVLPGASALVLTPVPGFLLFFSVPAKVAGKRNQTRQRFRLNGPVPPPAARRWG